MPSLNALPPAGPFSDDAIGGESCERSRLVVTSGEVNDGVVVIDAVGELCAPGGEMLLALAEQLIVDQVRRVELDLSAVSAADLCGVRALSDLHTMLERVGAELAITKMNLAFYPVDWHPIPTDDRAGRPPDRYAPRHSSGPLDHSASKTAANGTDHPDGARIVRGPLRRWLARGERRNGDRGVRPAARYREP